MIGERPVTGSCERCRQDHDLLIPEPGLGDLHLERIAERFGWCAGCDRLVGRRCCWVGDAALCAECSADVSTPGSSLTDASLTRDAFNAIAAAATSLAAAEARLGELPVHDEDRARNAWEDAWLEVGALTVRAECAASVVRRLEAGQPDGPHDRLAVLGAEWTVRSHAMTGCLRRVGLRIRARAADPAPSFTVPPDGVANDRAAPGPSGGVVTTLVAPAVAPPRTRVATSPPGSLQPIAIHPASVAPPTATPAPAAPRERTPHRVGGSGLRGRAPFGASAGAGCHAPGRACGAPAGERPQCPSSTGGRHDRDADARRCWCRGGGNRPRARQTGDRRGRGRPWGRCWLVATIESPK